MILLFCFLAISCSYVKSTTIWGTYNNVSVYICPNPKNLTSKIPIQYQSDLPQTFTNGAYKQWCLKSDGSGLNPPASSLRTPYIKSMNGFRVEMSWTGFKRANYTSNETLSGEWCVFYNENEAYSGGAEFGFCSNSWARERGFLSFYYGRDSNQNLNTSEVAKFTIKFKPVYSPGINYLNFSAVAVNSKYVLTFDSSIDNLKTITRENFEVPFPVWHQEFRYNQGKITAFNRPNFNIYGSDTIEYRSIEYCYDDDFF